MVDDKGRFVATHGDARRGAGTSGKVTTEYRSWQHMLSRCYTETCHAYAEYGGRGIVVCERWRRDYSAFLEDMGRKPGMGYSLERIDVNGNYEPGNVKWATRKEQNRNRRDNKFVTAFGQVRCIGEWAELCDMHRETLWDRIVRFGWGVERALTQPLKNYPRRRRYTNV